jgi:hypothetical protein
MSKKLPILLSAQIASGVVNIECIGTVQGIVTAHYNAHDETVAKAEKKMFERAIELGGEVVIDPQLLPSETETYYTATMFCRVGKFVKEDAEGRSEE